MGNAILRCESGFKEGISSVILQSRIRILKDFPASNGPVAYWMSRDQRSEDNWALLYAQETAIERGQPLCVIFSLRDEFLGAAMRQYTFMLRGLEETSGTLERKGIPFFLLRGKAEEEIPRFVEKQNVGVLVTDFDPLRIKREWKEKVAQRIRIPFFEVDAHNIVACWQASDKKEYGAYTIRPKINRLLPEFMEEFPELGGHPIPWPHEAPEINWQDVRRSLKADSSVGKVSWLKPGASAGSGMLRDFIENRLAVYKEARNDPTSKAQSNLSPYLHFGQLSAQRVALEIMKSSAPRAAKDAFLEELIIRRELADNLCFYEPRYDSVEGFPEWARKTLNDHRMDPRPYLYSIEEFEQARTHDELWNAAQIQMAAKGKMHGYMRMYWAKKILEWSESAQEALRTAVYLNDKYELDGRDPSGYAGIAWSIGGLHDRAWGERPVSGKIRYLSYEGCKRKFDVDTYVNICFGEANALNM